MLNIASRYVIVVWESIIGYKESKANKNVGVEIYAQVIENPPCPKNGIHNLLTSSLRRNTIEMFVRGKPRLVLRT